MADTVTNVGLDQAQFEQLFKAHFVHLCNFAQQYVQDADTAKDITQKVFIGIWENRSKINPKQSTTSYLFTSVKNRCLNYIRDHKKYRSRVLDLDCGDIDLAIEDQDDDLQTLQTKINDALHQLPEKCRLVFEMSRFRNMKYRDIAQELNISQKTVEAHMTKAMKSLRQNLGEYLSIMLLLLNS